MEERSVPGREHGSKEPRQSSESKESSFWEIVVKTHQRPQKVEESTSGRRLVPKGRNLGRGIRNKCFRDESGATRTSEEIYPSSGSAVVDHSGAAGIGASRPIALCEIS